MSTPIKNIVIVFRVILSMFLFMIYLSCTNHEKNKKALNNIAQIELGRYLFYDRRLSINNTKSCGTCHNQQFAFTDGYKRSLGAFADLHQRNAQPLFNLSYLKYFTAADSTIHTTLQQINNPLLKTEPIEMGVKGNEDLILKKIKADKNYTELFKNANYASTWINIMKAISAFELSIVSNNSAYDKYIKGDTNAFSVKEKRGKNLFFSKELNCVSCHGGFNFSSPTIVDNNGDTVYYFNTGQYNLDNNGAYPSYDQGLFEITNNKTDIGKYRVPTLRNLAFTAPYLHDGSAEKLDEIIDNYAAGGRNITQGLYKGNGIKNQYKHTLIKGFKISKTDKQNVIHFLLSLSDTGFVKNTKYQNPFSEDETKY